MTVATLAATNPDSLARGTCTRMAVELDTAMRSPAARAAYLALWGVEWEPLTGLVADLDSVERYVRSLESTAL